MLFSADVDPVRLTRPARLAKVMADDESSAAFKNTGHIDI
jgi:hypothetical protein